MLTTVVVELTLTFQIVSTAVDHVYGGVSLKICGRIFYVIKLRPSMYKPRKIKLTRPHSAMTCLPEPILQIIHFYGNSQVDARIVSDAIRIDYSIPFSEKLFSALKALWADGGIQQCLRRSNEYRPNDCVA